jgi:dolichol-phosphate mannosyltransferase
MPTYNESANVESISRAVLERLPGVTLLIVDDNSPDGTGSLADALAAAEPRIKVRHRAAKLGLGKAYIDGFSVALADGAARVVQMDADWSHPPDRLTALLDALGPTDAPRADLVIGSRYVPGGGVRGWGIWRRVLSRGGSTFARVLLRLPAHDLTGAFKAWRRETLATLPWAEVHSAGYVFMIETTYLAHRAGARIREVPIVFVDRFAGRSKMSRRIILEAFWVVVTLWWKELRGRGPRRAVTEVDR